MKRKKYTLVPEPEPEPLFSEAEQKFLARLVAKFGRDVVADAVRQVPLPQRPRRRGRPSTSERGLFPLYEALHFQSCIGDWTEEAREAGSKHPVKDAEESASEISGLSIRTIRNKRRAAAKFVERMMKKGPD